MNLDEQLQPALEQRKQRYLYRQRRCLQSCQQPNLQVDGQLCLSFTSNDYLGLASHPQLIAAVQQASRSYGVGSGASHLVNGHSELHQQLEQQLAIYTGRQRTLLFGNGYMANLGVISALLERQDVVFEDRLNHASLLDGGLLSRARIQRYAHNDVVDLERRLSQCAARRRLVVCDGVFSMDGDLAPLRQLALICKDYGAWLMVDDAHGFGVLGAQGKGTVLQQGLDQSDCPVYIATLGKALGAYGAFVAGSEVLIETLIQQARTYIYTTAMPPAMAAAALAGLQLLQRESWRQAQLQKLISTFKAGALQLGLPLLPSDTPIQPLLVGSAKTAITISNALQRQGILVAAIRPPTVPKGSARLRISLSAAHTLAQVDRLLSALASLQHQGLLSGEPD